MKVLLLGDNSKKLMEEMIAFGDKVVQTQDVLTSDSELCQEADFLISYGYRHIIKPEVLDRFPRRAINLHISYLPWNRGTDPNLWSFLEDTPKGVTIHYLDAGIDTGDVLVQEKVDCQPDDTLATSYDRLANAIEALFVRTWPDIREGRIKSRPQDDGGSFHRRSDRKRVEHLLTHGWDTPVSMLIEQVSIHNFRLRF